jgi:hypothetical protein
VIPSSECWRLPCAPASSDSSGGCPTGLTGGSGGQLLDAAVRLLGGALSDFPGRAGGVGASGALAFADLVGEAPPCETAGEAGSEGGCDRAAELQSLQRALSHLMAGPLSNEQGAVRKAVRREVEAAARGVGSAQARLRQAAVGLCRTGLSVYLGEHAEVLREWAELLGHGHRRGAKKAKLNGPST